MQIQLKRVGTKWWNNMKIWKFFNSYTVNNAMLPTQVCVDTLRRIAEIEFVANK